MSSAETSSSDALPADVTSAYSPQIFSELAEVLRMKLADHLQQLMRGDGKVLYWQDPNKLAEQTAQCLASGDADTSSETGHRDRFTDLLGQMLQAGQNLHHPHYIGHQVPACMPLAALFDMVNSATNQPMAIYEMGPWATAVEHALVNRLLAKIGWSPETSSGLLTSGGSLANLTALLTARNVVCGNSWQSGAPDNTVLLVQADAHYCVTRAAGILGLGSHSVRKVKVDERRRMDVDHLERLIREERSRGKTIMAVSAAACATPTGAFDPLKQIADVCERHDVWLHVDAAHGGGALMSRQHRDLLRGIHRADSVVWDAHKMLFVPALCAGVFYRQKEHRYAAFQQDAPYLFDSLDAGSAAWDGGLCTVECTKRALGFSLWGVWSMFGETLFEQLVDRVFSLCRDLYERLQQEPDFETLHDPECNILVFRYLPDSIRNAGLEAQNQFQHAVRTALVRSGKFYIVQTVIDGVAALRTTVMNPLTTPDDLEELIHAIRAASISGD
jgi:L-2,4-diaminobutyrate decarboxylase